MPAGVSWSTYLRFATVAMLTMMAGSQTVHMIYRPLDDLDEIVERKKELMKQMYGSQKEKPSAAS